MTLSVWTFIELFVLLFVIILIVEIRLGLNRANESLEEMKQGLDEIKSKLNS